MDKPIEFAKLSGCGNDFICIDGRDRRFDTLLASPERVGHFARTLCRRRLGVGADDVIFALRAENASEADIGCRFFEPDGTEAELCGNGTACLAFWTLANGWVHGREVRIETHSGVVRGRQGAGDYVRVCIPVPHDVQRGVAFAVEGKPWSGDFAVTGVPHLVVYVDDVGAVDMARLGPAIRHHERFGPRGVNVNFTQVLGEGALAVRTFEFGVEDETLACGTGCSTAAVMAARRFGWPGAYLGEGEPVRIRVRSGDEMRVYLALDEQRRPLHTCLETVVRFMYRGTLDPTLAAQAVGEEAPARP